ncbi:MAG: proline dehydrogenase family protein [Bacteroidia bacterium]|nr:proline dehydrogenase family protein [Bacteroidia bacterium]MDW8159396.1 proline dehydrogenase family protein [Bacteroidia bacterium]
MEASPLTINIQNSIEVPPLKNDPFILEGTPFTTSFDNTEIAFRYKSDSELRKAYILFSSIQSNLLVKIGPSLVNWALKVGVPIRPLLKYYFFDQFCGGETLEACLPKIETLKNYNVKTILDYGVESLKTEQGYNQCAEEIIKTITFASSHKNIPFVAMKITGIGGTETLEKISSGKASEYDKLQFQKIKDRLVRICEVAKQLQQPIFIDAEESWIQPAIDSLCEEMMFNYNTQQPLIFTTIQMYRNDRWQYLHYLKEKAAQQKIFIGIKLVRGAYIEKENKRASQLGYPTPLYISKKNVDLAFNNAAHLLIKNIDSIAFCAGTHNEESCLLLATYAQKAGIPFDHPHLSFSQLYGMSDQITFNLAEKGFNVAKYIPFGPLDAVLPYLFRRAQENTSIAGQTSKELILLEKEIRRRKKAALISK